MRAAELLDSLVRATGCPIDGVAALKSDRAIDPGWQVVTRADGVRVRIDFQVSATTVQKQAARAAILAADLTPRRPRTAEAILVDLSALSQPKQLHLLLRLAAEAMLRDPALARRAGEAIDGDEPDV